MGKSRYTRGTEMHTLVHHRNILSKSGHPGVGNTFLIFRVGFCASNKWLSAINK
jgi:hypothetical protein